MPPEFIIQQEKMKIKVGIMGGAGYTAGELLRLLVRHPNVDITFVQSNSQVGKFLYELHTDLLGETEQKFVNEPDFSVDLIYICSGHGKTGEFLDKYPEAGDKKIIDLSNDFRMDRKEGGFIYGLPEVYKNEISKADKIANPGCFATTIQLGLLPLAKAGKLNGEIHVNAITGSTGAGVGLSATSHFSWRHSNISVYKPFGHQHLEEIQMTLKYLHKTETGFLNFIPVRGNFTRGIFASIYTNFEGTTAKARELFKDFYRQAPFVFVTDVNPDLKQVVNTNKCVLFVEVHNGKLLILSMLDNLLKGASGQAVQNMNIMFGLEEKTGLDLKAIGF